VWNLGKALTAREGRSALWQTLTTKEGWSQIWEGLKQPYADAWHKGEYGEAFGRGAFDIASLLLGTKGADKALKSLGIAGKTSRLLGGLGRTTARGLSAFGRVGTRGGEVLGRIGDRLLSSPMMTKVLTRGSQVLSSKPVSAASEKLSCWFGGKGSIAGEVARSKVVPTLHSSGAKMYQLTPKRLAVFENHLEDLSHVFQTYSGQLNLSRKEFWRHVLPHYHVYDAPVAPAIKANMRKAFEKTPGVIKTTRFPWEK
jgi:hypothetical protein